MNNQQFGNKKKEGKLYGFSEPLFGRAKELIRKKLNPKKITAKANLEKIVLKKDIKDLEIKSADSEASLIEKIVINNENVKALVEALDQLELKLNKEICVRCIGDINVLNMATIWDFEKEEAGKGFLELKRQAEEQLIKIEDLLKRYEI